MKISIYIGKIDVPLEHGELKSLIKTKAEVLAHDISSCGSNFEYVESSLERINQLIAKLREFEKAAEASHG